MTAADIALARAEWQDKVFAVRPRRMELLRLRAQWPLQQIRVSVVRNHAVEPVLGMTAPFLAYAALAAHFSVSAYDDSLSSPPLAAADVHIVWLDPTPYAAGGRRSAAALAARLDGLRATVHGPMLLVDAPSNLDGAVRLNAVLRDAADRLLDVHVFPFAEITAPIGGAALEARAASMGTPVSGEAGVLVAQHLGLQWIPALLGSRAKAIVVDLDNTIIGGVLGEDGVDGVTTSGTFADVRTRLLQLHEQGTLLALATKNDPSDVEALFTRRPELAGLRGALTAVEAGWHEKAAGVMRVADRLRIGLDSVLVVDDNPAEIAAMAGALADPWFVVARDPELSTRALTLHPGLLALRADALGAQRTADVIAGEQRAAERRDAADPATYLASLNMRARLSIDASPDLARLSELSRKTNQFNTTLARLTETEVSNYMTAIDRSVVSIRLRDRLSDSGLIGAVFARRDGENLVIDEIAISCRALGRSIEGTVLRAALARLREMLGGERVMISFTTGPRNTPALDWLANAADTQDAPTGSAGAEWREAGDRTVRAPVEVSWDTQDAWRRTA